MSPLRALLALFTFTPAVFAVVGPDDIYQESGGILVMEAERTPTPLGTGTDRWEFHSPGETHYVPGATGGGHIEFQGNSSNGGTPKTPLTYKFKIHEGGYYHLHLRSRARLDGAEPDKNNDCYVKVTGATFGPGPNAGNDHLDDAPLSLLTVNTKMYGASPTTWGWANELDAGGTNNKRYPVYNFTAGSTYTLTISGRSTKFNIDRIVFRKSTIATASAKSAAIPESSLVATPVRPQSVTRLMLVNADTDTDIGPLVNGGTINLAVTGTSLNVRADTHPPVVGSVRFRLDGATDSMTQSGVPYTLGGDGPGDDYLPWIPSPGSHSLLATPYTGTSATGSAGTPLTVSFSVVNTVPSGAPTANAGPDQALTLPLAAVTLSGSGSDPGGSIAAHAWSQISGPNSATLTGATTATLAASSLVQGSYVFRLTVTDNSGLTASDEVLVHVASASGNPVANAGPDLSITLPTASVTLNGSATDSGGSISAHAWTQISGPNTATLSGAASASLTASALVQGAYIFRLTVTDNSGLTASDDAIVNVAAAPGGSGQSIAALVLVDANSDSDIGAIASGSTIDLSVTGANLNIRADTAPSVVGSVRFALDSNPNYMTQSGVPYALGGDGPGNDYLPWTPSLGTHTLTATPFTAAAGGGTAGTPKTVIFTVINSQLSGVPQVDAGTDRTLILPQSSVTLAGNASDAEGPIASHAWTQVSGPATASLSGAATASLTASALVQGSYVFRLTVTDGSANSASDEVAVFVLPASTGGAGISGELKQWHKVTLGFAGPLTGENATPNPFTDYRLNVTFTHPATGKTYLVPGYYAADGNAANTSATTGNLWRVHFAPDETGAWTYAASFRTGTDVATNSSPTAGTSAGFFDGDTGTLNIAPTDKTGIDLRRKGRLQYVGKHHLRFAGTGEFFMKAGPDAPENLLSYADFDGAFKTDGNKDELVKTWSAHVADWQPGDPVWQGSKGKGIIGAVNYLAAEGLNSFSFLTLNINGDDRNVFPYTTYGERNRLDVSRLDQWETVFEHGTRKGMYLHFKTQEIENQTLLDGGALGNQRKLYYRELIARFGHHLALNWNLGEECTVAFAQKQAWAQYFHDTDPYKNHLVIHNGSNHRDMMGDASKLTGFSLQMGLADFSDTFAATKDYVDRSFNSGKPWVVACDEPGDSRLSVRPDNDAGTSHIDARRNALWGNIMAGGAGCEFYFGYDKPHSDLTCQDFRSRNAFWDYCRHAIQLLTGNDVPFELMKNQNSLVSGNGANANRCLARTGDTYLVQLHGGGTHTLNLTGVTGEFTVKWFNPRSGGALVTRPSVFGGSVVSLGSPPSSPGEDWIVLVQSASGGGASNTAPAANAGPDQSVFLAGPAVQVILAGSVTDDGLPEVSALTRAWSLVSGPAAVTIAHPAAASTAATFTAAGTYTLRLTAADTEFTAADDVVVTVAASAGNTAPVFSGLSASTFVNTPLVINESQILASASDPDGDPLDLVPDNDSSALGGSVTIAGGTLTYLPVIDLAGSDSIALTVQDGRGGFTTANLTIQVFPDDGISGLAPPTVERFPGNQVRLRYTGRPGFNYTFQRSPNLVTWTNLQTLSPGPGGSLEFTDPFPLPGKSFYRLATP